MDDVIEKIKLLAQEHGESLASVERKLSFGNGTISRWKTSTPSTEKVAQVADYFNVSIDYLLGRTEKRSYWELNKKDKKDIQRQLDEMLNGLSNDESLAFYENGEELSEQDKELLAASLEQVITLSKTLAKKKFTPKKYRK